MVLQVDAAKWLVEADVVEKVVVGESDGGVMKEEIVIR